MLGVGIVTARREIASLHFGIRKFHTAPRPCSYRIRSEGGPRTETSHLVMIPNPHQPPQSLNQRHLNRSTMKPQFECEMEGLCDAKGQKHVARKSPPNQGNLIAKLIPPAVIFMVVICGQPLVSIPAGHLAIVDFFGYVPTNTISSGLNFKTLYASTHSFSLKTQLLELTMNVPTTEGLIVELDVSVLYRIHANMVRNLYLTVGHNYQEVVLLPEVTSTVRSLTASVSSKALYSASRDELSENIKVQLNKQLASRGIEVESALLRKVVLPKLVTTAIEQKLMAEQDSQRMEFILTKERQEAERKRIEAQGIADFQSIVSAGISNALLEWKGIEATERLAHSNNAKVLVIGNNKNGLPIILGDGSTHQTSKAEGADTGAGK